MNILVGDDHSILRKGIISILIEAFPNANIEEANDGIEIIKKAVQKKWDIIISDISMPNKSGLEILKELKQITPKTPVLILSVHAPEQYAIRALKAGAAGYLTKESAPDELVKVVTHILSGHKYITPEIAEILIDYHAEEGEQALHQTLSNREFEILKLIASGKTISEVADILTLSINTISTYRFRILEKMKMKTNAELTRYAVTHNLV
ncbi:MAG: response regulator transcription factor [Bacteroidetes bacterium]|nr:response regulator transcription factor [Bacteroidota bacterium]MBS1648715.1 response regulator transcription factor [Bacteroidota bacterium]